MNQPLGPLVRVGRRAAYDLGEFSVHNGVNIVELTSSEFDDWIHARYNEKLANAGLITDDEQGVIPVRNGILWDFPDATHPVIWGIVAHPQQSMTLTSEEFTLWGQADGMRPLASISDRPWPLVVRLVQIGAWSLRWSPEVIA